MSNYEYEKELLTVLMEECAEVIQAASKVIRFGPDSTWEGQSALSNLEKELGDLQCMVDLLHQHDMVSYVNMDECAVRKYEKLKEWSNLVGL